jgi:hypothetical protein
LTSYEFINVRKELLYEALLIRHRHADRDHGGLYEAPDNAKDRTIMGTDVTITVVAGSIDGKVNPP